MEHLFIEPSEGLTWSCCKWKQQSISLGSGPVYIKGDILLEPEKVSFPFCEGGFFVAICFCFSISLFSNDLRQVCNLLPCSPARKSDPRRIRENSRCFLLPLHRIFLSIFALALWTLVPPIFCLPVLPVARNYLVF